jgi:hypothetical protein
LPEKKEFISRYISRLLNVADSFILSPGFDVGLVAFLLLDGDPMGIRRRPAYLHRRQKLQIEGSPSIAADHG